MIDEANKLTPSTDTSIVQKIIQNLSPVINTLDSIISTVAHNISLIKKFDSAFEKAVNIFAADIDLTVLDATKYRTIPGSKNYKPLTRRLYRSVSHKAELVAVSDLTTLMSIAKDLLNEYQLYTSATGLTTLRALDTKKYQALVLVLMI